LLLSKMNEMPKTPLINAMVLNSVDRGLTLSGRKRVDATIRADTNREATEEIIVVVDVARRVDHLVGKRAEAEAAAKVVVVATVARAGGVRTEEIHIATVDREKAGADQAVETTVAAEAEEHDVAEAEATDDQRNEATANHHRRNIRRGKNKILITVVITLPRRKSLRVLTRSTPLLIPLPLIRPATEHCDCG